MGLCYVCVAMAMWTSGIFSSREEWFSFPSQSQDSLCLNAAWRAQSTNLRLTLMNLSPSMLVEELERGGLRGWVLSLEFLLLCTWQTQREGVGGLPAVRLWQPVCTPLPLGLQTPCWLCKVLLQTLLLQGRLPSVPQVTGDSCCCCPLLLDCFGKCTLELCAKLLPSVCFWARKEELGLGGVSQPCVWAASLAVRERDDSEHSFLYFAQISVWLNSAPVPIVTP